MNELSALLAGAQTLFFAGFATFVRVAGVVSVMPGFGERFIPIRIRLALALVFTAVVMPAVGQTEAMTFAPTILTLSKLAKEALVGLFFGLFLRFFVIVLQIAGSIAAQSISVSQIFGGAAGVDPQPAIAHFLVVAATALAVILDLHLEFAAYLLKSYALVPLGTLPARHDVVSVGVARISQTFSLGFSLAAPFVIASVIYNVTLGFINRAMPQLMVSFVGAPALTAGGLLLFVFAAPVMLSVWTAAFESFLTHFGVQ